MAHVGCRHPPSAIRREDGRNWSSCGQSDDLLSQQCSGPKRVHLGVATIGNGHQLGVASLLDDPAMIEHDNLVGHAHRGEPMRDQEHGTTSGERSNSFEHVVLDECVESRRWFIEHDER